MAKLENYFFASRNSYDEHDCGVIIPKENEAFFIAGDCYNRSGYEDGTLIVTSKIEKIENGVAITRSGSRYELGNKHPDLVDMEKTMENGIPVITSWDMDYYDYRDSYVLEGWFDNGEKVSGKATSQEGNLVTIDGIQYFVIWRNLRNPFTYMMFIKDQFKCTEAWSCANCKPILVN